MIYWIQEASPSAPLIGATVGAVVGLVGVLIGQVLQQRRHSQTLEQTAAGHEQTAQRHSETLLQTAKLEDQRAHEAALQKYFERMGELLIEKELRRSPDKRSDQKHQDKEHDDVRLTARAQTLTVLQGLDPNRKRLLVLFLYEASLIQSGRTVVDLVDADLSCAALSGVDLKGASLRRANLRKADLSKANLSECLNSARLVEYLEKTGRRKDNLIEWLKKSDLGKDGLSECMSKGDLIECLENAALIEKVDGSEANLQECLIKARLCEANFIEKTNLREADLSGADLSGADLSGADLSEAKNLTQEQINKAIGDEDTKPPDHLKHPEHWSKGESEES